MRRVAILALIILASCRPQLQNTRQTIDYVSEILANKNSTEYALLSQELLPSNDICIVGAASAEMLADYLATFDYHDNVSGASLSDELPDFAGESFDCLSLDPSFSQLDTNALRLASVQHLIASLDTTIYLSPYDVEGISAKMPAKILILSEPLFEQYGRFDIDTLLRSTQSQLKLLSGFDLCLEKLSEAKGGEKINVGIVGRKDCEEAYLRYFAQKTAVGSRCVFVNAEKPDSVLHSLAATQLDLAVKTPLDAVLVDDYDLDVDLLKLELADMLSVLNPDSVVYSRLLSEKMSILDSKHIIAEALFEHLRSANLFTHRIAYPQVNSYKTIVRDSITIMIPGSYVQN